MQNRRGFVVSAAAASVLAAFAIGASPGLAAGGDVTLAGTQAPAAAKTATVGTVPAGSQIAFAVQLRPRDAAGARALATAVSTPGSAAYGRFLTPAQWEARFSPSAGQVAEVTAFLKNSGFNVAGVSADRMEIDASGTAAQIEHAFATSLSYHRVDGHQLRLNDRPLAVPGSLAGVILGIAGISQSIAKPASAPPPPGFRVAPPCSHYYGQLIDSTLPPFGHGYQANPVWVTCGYNPSQLRSGYNENQSFDGTGSTVAIVDAYAAPTLLSDAQTYASKNDPSHPLSSSQFSEANAPTFNQGDLCGASGWYGEQTLDVEAVHAMAPGAHIVFAGATNCFDEALNASIRRIVDGHLANIITNSYGDNAGDVLDPPSIRQATDNLLMMAAGTGVSVLFSSGDSGDEFVNEGFAAADYPASSPWATAVGGTTTAIDQSGQRTAEYGWSTARSLLCTATTVSLGACTQGDIGKWTPISLGLDGGSGGGTSRVYPQPAYQAGIVPSSLSDLYGSTPMRVVPDISLDADPATGMLVGETQTFPNGVYYDQYRIGGTSLSSPLLAGLLATGQQMAGHPLGFLNPALYGLSGQNGGLNDVLRVEHLDQSRADYVNGINSGDGFLYWTRLVDYEGPEQFCPASGPCSLSPMTLHAARGYDNMTGLGTPGNGFLGLLAAGK